MKLMIFKPKAFFALLVMTGIVPSIVFTLWRLGGILPVFPGIAIGTLTFALCFLLSGFLNSKKHYWRITGYGKSNVLLLFLITCMLLGVGGILIGTTTASFFGGLKTSGLMAPFVAGWVCLIGTIIYWKIAKTDWEIKKG